MRACSAASKAVETIEQGDRRFPHVAALAPADRLGQRCDLAQLPAGLRAAVRQATKRVMLPAIGRTGQAWLVAEKRRAIVVPSVADDKDAAVVCRSCRCHDPHCASPLPSVHATYIIEIAMSISQYRNRQ